MVHPPPVSKKDEVKNFRASLKSGTKPRGKKMMFVIVGAILLYVVYEGISAIVNAPEGWEDDDGFHIGKRQ